MSSDTQLTQSQRYRVSALKKTGHTRWLEGL